MTTVLVTGGGGYLGRRVAERLLGAGDARVDLWVHAADERALAARRAELAPAFAPWGDRARISGGELGAEEPFAGVDPRDVTAIVHSAAVTRFNVDEETARVSNVEGTARALDFAERCPRLRAFVLLSTVYASGLRPGLLAEDPLDGGGPYANHYERSKAAAEALLRARPLPGRVVRVATVVADDLSGRVTQHNAVHNTLQLLFYGLLSTIPGRAETPVYLVTGELVAEAVVAVLERGEDGSVYHAAHRREQSMALGPLLDRAWDTFAEDESFRRRRLLRPLLVEEEAFGLLDRALTTFAGGAVSQALSSITPFARQLFVARDVRNERLLALLGRDPAPDPARLVEAACRELVRTRWGREAGSRA